MLFSIIIPTYNRREKLQRTIESLLNQTFADFEIIVIDDGSTDETKEMISSLKDNRLRYCYKQNGGKHTALNLGIEMSQGELWMILDSDDQLTANALYEMREIWNNIKNDCRICGIMGRSMANEQLIGLPFDGAPMQMSYIDFHFGENGGKYLDCCECIRTDIIKKYRWPEDPNTHFVPEAYVMDQIGLDYNLYCVDNIWKIVEYLDDGITKNYHTIVVKNCVGYLIDIVSKIEDVFPKAHISLRRKILTWWQYWNYVGFDEKGIGKRVSKVTPLGYIVKFASPILSLVKKKKDSV